MDVPHRHRHRPRRARLRPPGHPAPPRRRGDQRRGPLRLAVRAGDDAVSLRGGVFTLDVAIPANTTAEVWVPARRPARVTERGGRSTGAPPRAARSTPSARARTASRSPDPAVRRRGDAPRPVATAGWATG
ncbi:alpha-L-rhamnosidase C-terminal domain-containing protein [Streptomyces sp. M19]